MNEKVLLITKKPWFRLLIMAILVWLLFTALRNVRYVSISTEKPSEISVSKNISEPSFTEEKVTTLKKLTWGNPVSVIVRDDFTEVRKVERESFSLNPFVSLSLNTKPQIQSNKLSSDGSRCTLYSNPRLFLLITSDCSTNANQNIYRVTYGATARRILENLNVIQAAPSRSGFMFVSESESSYDVASYNATTTEVTTLKTDMKERPFLITNEEGYVSGLIKKSSYSRINDLKNSVQLKDIQLNSINDGQIVLEYGVNIVVFNGNSPYRSGEEAGDQPTEDQTLTFFSKQTGDIARSENIDKNTKIYHVSRLEDGVVLAGQLNSGRAVFITVGEDGPKNTIHPGFEPAANAVSTDKGTVYYVHAGDVWSYDFKDNTSRLIYRSNDTNVNNVQKIGSLLYIAADSSKPGFTTNQFSFSLDPNTESPNRVRIESVLPVMNWSGDLLFADVYLNNIVVNYQSPNTQRLQAILRNIGVSNVTEYALKINEVLYFVQETGDSPSYKLNTEQTTSQDDYTGDGAPPEDQ